MQRISKEELRRVIETKNHGTLRPYVLYFSADWCSQCKVIKPIMEAEYPEVDVYNYVVDENFDQIQDEVHSALNLITPGMTIMSLPRIIYVPSTYKMKDITTSGFLIPGTIKNRISELK